MTDQRNSASSSHRAADALPLLGTKSSADGIGGDRARGVWLQLFVQQS